MEQYLLKTKYFLTDWRLEQDNRRLQLAVERGAFHEGIMREISILGDRLLHKEGNVRGIQYKILGSTLDVLKREDRLSELRFETADTYEKLMTLSLKSTALSAE